MNFSINMDGNLAASANKDADALERLQTALRAEEKALGAMERQMKALQKASSVDVATFQKLDAAIKASKDKSAGLTAQLVNMGATGIDPAKDKALNLAQAFGSLQQRAGPVGQFLAALGPWGVAAAIGIGAIVVAAGLAAFSLKKLVDLVSQFSEARGDAERVLTTVFDSEKGAERTYNAIEDVTKRVAISQEKAIEVADSLSKAGVYSGDAMVRAVESIGKAEAARKGAGQVIQGIIERSEKSRQMGFGNMGGFTVNRAELRAAGIQYKDFLSTLSKQTGRSMQDVAGALRVGRVSVAAGLDALNATVDRKLGPLADKKFYTIGAASQRLRDSFGRIFDQVDTSKFSRAIDAVAKFFDDTTVSGQTVELLLSGLFDGLSSAMAAIMPYAQAFGEFLILTYMKIRIAVEPLRKALANAFGGDSAAKVKTFEGVLMQLSDFIAAAFVPAMVAGFALLTAAVWAVVPAVWGLASGVLAATWPFLAIGAAIFAVVKYCQWFVDAIAAIDWGYLVDHMGQVGIDIVKGLIAGILPGGSLLVDAMTNLAEKGLNAFKQTFGIKSPSTVMRQQGLYIDQGLSQGIKQGSDQPTSAMGDMSQSTLGASPAALGGGSGGPSGGSLSVTFAEGAFQITGVQGAADLEARMPQIFADIFEQLGLSMGAPVPE
jgi:hypothetical protein